MDPATSAKLYGGVLEFLIKDFSQQHEVSWHEVLKLAKQY